MRAQEKKEWTHQKGESIRKKSAVRNFHQGFYKGLVIRRGHKKTIIALGHKILKVIFILLSKKEPYKDPEVDYEALMVLRNAPRWIKTLKKYKYL